MSLLLNDIQGTLRQLVSRPGVTWAIVLTLAFGIGANTAMFSVVNGVLIQELPFEESERIVEIRQRGINERRNDIGLSVSEINDYGSQLGSVEQLVEYHHMNFFLVDDNPTAVRTGIVSANYFGMLGITPTLGRDFIEEDDVAGGQPAILLTYPFWQEHYGGNEQIVGRVVEMNDKPHRIVGVLPAFPQFPEVNDIYSTTMACPTRSSEGFINDREARMMSVFGRIAGDADFSAAQAEVELVTSRIHESNPTAYPAKVGFATTAMSLDKEFTKSIRSSLYLLIATTALVLLITCANVTNLSLAQQSRRQRELAIRSSLGADRMRIVRQLVTESVAVALIGGVLGLGLAYLSIDTLVEFASRFTTKVENASINGTVLLFTLGISVLTGVIVGVVPAFGKSDLLGPLKEGGSHATSSKGNLRLRRTLAVLQISIAFVLLAGAALTLRSFLQLQSVDPGFDPEGLTAVTVPLNEARYDPPAARNFANQLREQVSALGPVEELAVASTYPFGNGLGARRLITRVLLDSQLRGGEQGERVFWRAIDPNYFELLGIDLLSGRAFNATDVDGARAVAVVSQAMVDKFWPEGDPIEQRFTVDNGDTWLTVVGVAPDVKHAELSGPTFHEYYVPFEQAPQLAINIIVKSSLPSSAVSEQVERVVKSLDPQQPVGMKIALDDAIATTLTSPRLLAQLLSLFALVALIITVAGISGLFAYATAERTREFGIRRAIGAKPTSIQWLVMRQGLILIGAGLLVGVIGAATLGKLLESLVVGVATTDIATYTAVGALLLLVAGFACWLPAFQAGRVDPKEALRTT